MSRYGEATPVGIAMGVPRRWRTLSACICLVQKGAWGLETMRRETFVTHSEFGRDTWSPLPGLREGKIQKDGGYDPADDQSEGRRPFR